MTGTADHPDVIAFPPMIFLAVLGLSGLLGWLVPLDILPPALSGLAIFLALPPIVLALGLAGGAILAFRRAGTHVEPHKPSLVIVTDGPYRVTRNPMYLGLILMLIGIGLAASLDWVVPLALPFWLVLHHGVVLREEAYLGAKFGHAYTDLLTRTRRWF